ncbi:MAG: energy-coupling factor ABC transporter ATP-binding protein [Nanoarchaeota archaeon]|nr:energy-coupling factor ABC transporter ATP-binding protein [Nanoarchaeota archaeon]MBU1321942.1 energy-coupling factor ABC transporter ATP-binding protein [Nanoarchaeota archaeon]MBU1597938.1 energy-coupling factor ABC transporter ATP-binding protein [Nanoarchaeota archaeon]MBU2441175.1 energy-coupling factor ABC transporter ATP-binding protein [Nanoarchaeota archaeon]
MDLLKITNLTKSFGNKTILKNLNLTIKKGEIMGIFGKSGVGKTTLLRIINMLEEYEKGKIHFQGQNIKTRKLELQRKMAMVFQTPMLFNESVLSNVIFGLRVRGIDRTSAKKRAEKMLTQLGIKEFDKNASELSGGEAQRVVLIQAIIIYSDLLLLDEPSANLDEKNVKLLEKIILDLKKQQNTTVLIASHDAKHIKNICNKVFCLKNGKLSQVKT